MDSGIERLSSKEWLSFKCGTVVTDWDLAVTD